MTRQFFFALVVSVSLLSFIPNAPVVFAQSASELQAQIDAQNKQIEAINAEIANYQKELNVISGQKQTLQGAVKSLDISLAQLNAQLSLIQSKINAANLRLKELGSSIQDKEAGIALDKQAVAQSLRTMNEASETTIVEYFLDAESITEAWENVDNLARLNEALQEHSENLASDKIILTNKKVEEEKTKKELSALAIDLGNQKKAVNVNKESKVALLKQTQNSESQYQALIAKKNAQRVSFEAELLALQDTLKTVVDPAALPHSGSGILNWPFQSTYMERCASLKGVLGNNFCITQYFGTTSFSTSNPQVYNGMGHNGVDFSAPTGTPIAAALSGTVTDTGNTDLIPGCYSFGKWVVVKHANGLSTLYAHLSSIQAVKGQSVSTGQVIGYSGSTGYATGPHLHFATYASQGLQIMTLAQFRGATTACANAKMPVAPRDAYLNPMSYL